MPGTKLLEVQIDKKKLTNLSNKMAKYPPYAIQQGMEAVSNYLNSIDMTEMYPPESDEPFKWSSEKQRKAYFASNGFGGGVPYSRTYQLADSGEFMVNSSSFQGTPYSTISYKNPVPYSKFVITSDAIVGLVKRGWRLVNKFVMTKSKEIGNVFRSAVKDAWNKMQEFMYGGGAGL